MTFAAVAESSGGSEVVAGVMFEVVETVLKSLVICHVRCQLQVGAPVGRVETPVTRARLVVAVRVADELFHVELVSARRAAHEACRRPQRARALAETPVHHRDCVARLVHVRRGRRTALVTQQDGAQPLGISQRHKSTPVCRLRQDAIPSKQCQLAAVGQRDVDSQAVAGRVYLRQRELTEHCVKQLRDAQTPLTAHHEARYTLAFQTRLHATMRVSAQSAQLRREAAGDRATSGPGVPSTRSATIFVNLNHFRHRRHAVAAVRQQRRRPRTFQTVFG